MTGEPPEGYLGATARVRRGPAPELVAAGYELELADAPLLARGLGLADLAHVAALGAIPDAEAGALRGALLELFESPPDIDPRYGDLVNARERHLEQRAGSAAGWLSAGRPRREAGRIAFRIALRALLLDLGDALVRHASALVDAAARERDTLMPDYTYVQVAQPTTAGHWLLSFAHPALRDLARLETDLAWVNRSPAGAGGVNGSRFAIDRQRLSDLLGFDAPIEHTRDAMWQTDGLTEIAWHAATATTNASRLAEDLQIYGSDEFGLLRIGDELCRASALMPQKRNPYALVVIRGAAGTLLGRAAGLLATQRTPSAQTDNLLYAYGELGGAVAMATRTIALAAATVESVVVDRDAAARAVRESDALAADVADTISLTTGLDYRSAYNVAGRAVAEHGSLDAAALEAAANELLGRGLGLDAAALVDALDPERAIASRTVLGGAASEPMDAMLRDCRDAIDAARARLHARRAAIESAERALL
jgi:argininosuccinate lyase